MTDVVETNTQIFSDSFFMVDAQVHVLQRVMNDIVNGTVYRAGAGVDFGTYLGEYFAVVGLTGFVANMKAAFPEEAPLIEDPDTDTVIFGGL